MDLEEKIRRRLAPFVVEGKIAAPHLESATAKGVQVNVKIMNAGCEADLQNAMADLRGSAHLVIMPA